MALDLETTGLNPDRDTIIEIGAVKFQGQEVIDTFETLVNPYRELSPFIKRLTGITQRNVDGAPPFAAVAGELLNFIGSHPLVGHNVSFDLGFLSTHGLQRYNEVYDTRDLASILLPYFTSYSLPRLAAELRADHTRPHRALADAQATYKVFLSLLDLASRLDPAIVAYIHHLASRARWPLGLLLGSLPSTAESYGSHNSGLSVQGSGLGLTGLDMESLEKRLRYPERSGRPSKGAQSLDTGDLATYLASGGLFFRKFPGFEHRPQQLEMARAVSDAINSAEHLIVEAGTGVGKSLSYLLPALIYSLEHGTRVVVSTNTINLQEQLLQHDIPALVTVLEGAGVIPKGEFRAVSLKGRANYLCLRRWNDLVRGESLSEDEARLLSKTLVWLQDTSSGDRGEINLSGKEGLTWSRISAGERGQCLGMRGGGFCFLRAARDKAEGAHMIVVNHALLLSDLAMGGGLLPEYQHLIVDEAQHLEEEATRQLGFQVSQNILNEEVDALGRMLNDARVMLRGSLLSGFQGERGEELIAEMDTRWSRRMREVWDRLWGTADNFLSHHQEEGGEQLQLRITRGIRAQPGWSDMEIAWENVDAVLADGIGQIERLRRFLDTLPLGSPADAVALTPELSTWQEGIEELRERLRSLLAGAAEERRIDWMSRVDEGRGDSASRSHIIVHSAPLDVGSELDGLLFSQKSSVILTSATLSTQGSFDYLRDRVGLAECKELVLGSPFDYSQAALLLIPEDIPTPDAWGYQQAIERVIVALGEALNGHTLVLFTSHAALRSTAWAIRGPLEAEGITVFAQGVDGSPRQLIQSFSENARGVILGTSSFWEGVDMSEGALKALVIARLPFHVPSEPIFAARSEQYDDSFHQYALPQAVLRFRQGVGRLIRSSRDKGAIVVLDKRIMARPYGKAFLDSIPPCTVTQGPLSTIPGHVRDWVGNGK